MFSFKSTLSALALLAASAAAAAAFPATSTTSLNVRSGPGTNYPVIDQLRAGEQVEVTATRGNWYQVDGQGWASASYLAEGGRSAPREVYSYYEEDPIFYFDDTPYFWNDSGYYWYWNSGRRHRVSDDWWYRHRHRVRWHNREHGSSIRPRPPHHSRPHRPHRPGVDRPHRPNRPGVDRPHRPRPDAGQHRPSRPSAGSGPRRPPQDSVGGRGRGN